MNYPTSCSYGHTHPYGDVEDCETAYQDELSRIRVSGADPMAQLRAALSVPTCAHDVALTDDCQACIDLA